MVAIVLACLTIPYYVARFRSVASVVGSRVPANLRSFHVHGSAIHVQDAVREFARKYGYSVADTDVLRGLLVLAEKPRGLGFPGMFYPVFLNQPAPDQTLVSVGCVSPLSGLVVPGEFPKVDSPWQNKFTHHLAAELVSGGHPPAQIPVPANLPPSPSARSAAGPAQVDETEPMPKNIIPLRTQITHALTALALLAYGTYGIVVDEIIVPGKHGSIVLHGWAAWVLYAAMICAVLVLVSVIVDNYDPRDDERYYHMFAHTFQVLGWSLFLVAIFVPIFVVSEPREMARLKPLALGGDAQAQYEVGRRYADGVGVRVDYGRALDWFNKAAAQGNAQAMNGLGIMYFHGEGVPRRLDEAATWYRRAAELGLARAQNNLGLMYMQLQILPKDYAKGIEWLRMAAEQGYARGMFNLAEAYEKGKGVEQDWTQAHMWYSLSGAAGMDDGPENAKALEDQMSAEDIREAQSLAREWQRRHSR